MLPNLEVEEDPPRPDDYFQETTQKSVPGNGFISPLTFSQSITSYYNQPSLLRGISWKLLRFSWKLVFFSFFFFFFPRGFDFLIKTVPN